eukprot:7809088-Alexandrium_andersonii.AAC.1
MATHAELHDTAWPLLPALQKNQDTRMRCMRSKLDLRAAWYLNSRTHKRHTRQLLPTSFLRHYRTTSQQTQCGIESMPGSMPPSQQTTSNDRPWSRDRPKLPLT